jgi:uncharacterized protein (TIGR03382 family)
VILAHFTSTDSASTALVLGIGLLVFGAQRRRRRMMLVGLVFLAGGLALGFTHTGE